MYVETIGNPVLDMTDVAEVARIAHAHGVPLIVDGTFTTPYLLRSIEHGADIVVNSLTKWMGGHGTAIGGIVTDAGRFDWKDPKFGLFNDPDPTYHGLRWARDLPPSLAAAAFALRLRTVPLRNLGACTTPDNAWMFLQGLETLRSGWTVSARTPKRPRSTWRLTPRWRGSVTPASPAIRPTRWRAGNCRGGSAVWWSSA